MRLGQLTACIAACCVVAGSGAQMVEPQQEDQEFLTGVATPVLSIPVEDKDSQLKSQPSNQITLEKEADVAIKEDRFNHDDDRDECRRGSSDWPQCQECRRGGRDWPQCTKCRPGGWRWPRCRECRSGGRDWPRCRECRPGGWSWPRCRHW